jgi:hypothetical protein
MWSKIFRKLRRFVHQARDQVEDFLRPVLRPNIAVWRNWEMLCRTGGLGAIGVSVIAQGGHVEPGSVILGASVLATSVYCAHRIGELEAQNDRSD